MSVCVSEGELDILHLQLTSFLVPNLIVTPEGPYHRLLSSPEKNLKEGGVGIWNCFSFSLTGRLCQYILMSDEKMDISRRHMFVMRITQWHFVSVNGTLAGTHQYSISICLQKTHKLQKTCPVFDNHCSNWNANKFAIKKMLFRQGPPSLGLSINLLIVPWFSLRFLKI